MVTFNPFPDPYQPPDYFAQLRKQTQAPTVRGPQDGGSTAGVGPTAVLGQGTFQPGGGQPGTGLPITGQGGPQQAVTQGLGSYAPPAPSGGGGSTYGLADGDSFRNSVFGDLFDPDKAVRNALRQQGISPLSADPRVRHMIQNASALLMPVWGGLMNGVPQPGQPYSPSTAAPGGRSVDHFSLDRLPEAIAQQVQRALAGQTAYYSPTHGMQMLSQLLRIAAIGQQGLANNNMGWAALDPTIQLITRTMADDQAALGMLTAATLGGIAPRMQSVISRSYQQLPELAEYMVAQSPERGRRAASFLDILVPQQGNPFTGVGWSWNGIG